MLLLQKDNSRIFVLPPSLGTCCYTRCFGWESTLTVYRKNDPAIKEIQKQWKFPFLVKYIFEIKSSFLNLNPKS